MPQSRSGAPPQNLNLRLCIAALVVISAVGFGGYGTWQYEKDHNHDATVLSVIDHTLQLLILRAPYLDHPANWQMHVGRLLSALFVFGAVIQGLAVVFRSELRLRRIRRRGGHVIICGLGRLGRQLAAEFQKGGGRVVVIEANADKVATAGPGPVVVTGDASDAYQLRRAGVTTARQLIVVCDDVQMNVAVAATAGEILSQPASGRPSDKKLEGWLFVPDAQLRQLFKRDRLFPHTGPRFQVNVRGLDFVSLAARQALESSPLDYERIGADSQMAVHLVIVGFGPMGQRLALQTAHVGHFANRRRPRITILERKDDPRVDLFLGRYPRFKELVDFDLQDFSHDAGDAAKQILDAFGHTGGKLATAALCWDSQSDMAIAEDELFRCLERDDPVNLKLALGLQQSAAAGMPRTLLFLTRRCGFAQLFGGREVSDSSITNVHVFGTIEETCSLDALMHESTDAVARVLHEHWYDMEKARQKKDDEAPKPAFRPWDQVDEIYKESNRHAADHISVKLRALGFVAEKIRNDSPRRTSFDGPQVEVLAEMEHARWCAELVLSGYSCGPGRRNDIAKTHPDIVPWNDLAESTKEYDRSQVRAIPKALERAGLGIYTANRKLERP